MKPDIIISFSERDYVKAMRCAAREDEIERHGRQIGSRPMKHASKKAYSRKSKYPVVYEY